jgi:hypothetical protein
VLARLTQLESLYLSYAPRFTDAGLEQLTGLHLARLCIHNASISRVINPTGSGSVELRGDCGKVRTLADHCLRALVYP